MPETLRVEHQENIATVSLLSLTMPPRFFRELGETFRELAEREDLRAVVLCSAAKHFSYGLDLPAAMQELGGALGGGGAQARHKLLRHIELLQGELDAVARCPVPVIAAVHGRCIGGGLDLISACDLRLATRDATFSLRETKVAIVADLGSLQRLASILGQGHLRELAFTGRDASAGEAVAMGLVNRVLDDPQSLREAATSLAREIAENPPLTVRGVKKVLDFGVTRRVQDGLDYVAAYNAAFLASEDLGEALAAFMDKRPPRFRGR